MRQGTEKRVTGNEVNGEARKCALLLCQENAEEGSEYCIFHMPIEKKEPVKFWLRFGTYFETKMEEYKKTGEKLPLPLDCQQFVFPPQEGWEFPKEIPLNINFTFAEFFGEVDFTDRIFLGQIVFLGAEFKERPERFYKSILGSAEYRKINDGINFNGAEFRNYANFKGSKFYCKARFNKAVFKNRADFAGVWFKDEAEFGKTIFEDKTNFNGATFEGNVYFVEALFTQKVEFGRAIFKNETFFSESEFRSSGVFAGAEFYDRIHLEQVAKEIERDAKGNIVRDGEGLIKVKDAEAFIDLVYSHFFGKGKAYTFRTSVRKWQFEGTSAIKNPGVFGFEETVWKTKRDKRKTLYEEELIGRKETTYEKVGEIYRLLRLNFESRLAFDQASDFHIGQMEMLLADPEFPDSKKFFLRLYRLLSNFGEDPWRPLWWLVVVWYFGFLALTAVTFTNTVPGLEEIFDGAFVMPWDYVSENLPTSYKPFLITLIETFKYFWGNIWAALKNFFILPAGEEPPIYFIINTIQKLAGGTLVAFAILALRRAFRR